MQSPLYIHGTSATIQKSLQLVRQMKEKETTKVVEQQMHTSYATLRGVGWARVRATRTLSEAGQPFSASATHGSGKEEPGEPEHLGLSRLKHTLIIRLNTTLAGGNEGETKEAWF